MKSLNIKYKTLSICIIASLFSLTGCMETIDLSDQIDAQPKLVLYCRLCPQFDFTYIMLTSSSVLYRWNDSDVNSFGTSSIYALKDGIVELSADGNTWKRAVFDEVRQQYLITQAELPIIEGHTYYIRASHEGYPDVSASCTVPYAREVNFRFDTVTVQSDVHWGEIWNEEHQDLYAEWNDYPGEQNYYMLANKFIMTHYYHSYNEDTHAYETDSITYSWNWWTPGLEDENGSYKSVFSDEGKDGQVMRGLLEAFYEENDYDDFDNQEEYYLLFLDRNCYLYEKTLNTDYSEFSAFLLEPMHTYSNIENGFGLFGAFNMQEAVQGHYVRKGCPKR